MSSHREAPEISKDPVADSTDVYAFVSPDQPETVTLIANYIPLQAPDGGPNFYEFADDVLYEIHIDNTGDGNPDISYQFRFTTVNNIPVVLPLQRRADHVVDTAVAVVQLEPPTDLHTDAGRQQPGQPVERMRRSSSARDCCARRATSGHCPRRTTGPWPSAAVHSVAERDRSPPRCSPGSGRRASTSIWAPSSTSGDLRPFAGDHAGGPVAGLMNGMPGVNSTADVNVHSLALQVPDERAHPRRPGGTERPGRGHRRVDDGQPPAGPGAGATGSTGAICGADRGPRCRDWETRWSTSSSSASAPRTSGTRSRRRPTAASS